MFIDESQKQMKAKYARLVHECLCVITSFEAICMQDVWPKPKDILWTMINNNKDSYIDSFLIWQFKKKKAKQANKKIVREIAVALKPLEHQPATSKWHQVGSVSLCWYLLANFPLGLPWTRQHTEIVLWREIKVVKSSKHRVHITYFMQIDLTIASGTTTDSTVIILKTGCKAISNGRTGEHKCFVYCSYLHRFYWHGECMHRKCTQDGRLLWSYQYVFPVVSQFASTQVLHQVHIPPF